MNESRTNFFLPEEEILTKIEETKEIRDCYIDFIEFLISKNNPNIIDIISELLEKITIDFIWNNDNLKNNTHPSEQSNEPYYFLAHELVITSVAILFHYDKFSEIYDFITRTYFLKTSYSNIRPCNITTFRHYCKYAERFYEQSNESSRKLYSITAKTIAQREKKPILTTENIAIADLLIYQLSRMIEIHSFRDFPWFPATYLYKDEYSDYPWIKLKSKKYCEKILPLFGLTSIEKLKIGIQNTPIDNSISYSGSFHPAPVISSYINPNEIGSLN